MPANERNNRPIIDHQLTIERDDEENNRLKREIGNRHANNVIVPAHRRFTFNGEIVNIPALTVGTAFTIGLQLRNRDQNVSRGEVAAMHGQDVGDWITAVELSPEYSAWRDEYFANFND